MSQVNRLSKKSSRTGSQTGRRLRSVGFIASFATLLLVAVFWLMVPPASQAQATTYYVTPGGSGNCLLPTDPCALHTAVSLATDGDEVRVAAGTYTRPGINADFVLTLTQSIILSGGYAPGNWTDPDPDINLTMLDGENLVNVLHIDNNAAPTVEGFSIHNGFADLNTGANTGAGIHIASGTPTIRNNRIYSNTASINPGGGIYDAGGATIENNEIFDNQATGGGSGAGIEVENGGNLTIIRLNEIYNNSAGGSGGGIRVTFGAAAILEANIIHDNVAASGGGLYTFGPTQLYSNLFYANMAQQGGGIGFSADATLWNNTIAGNTGTTDSSGILVFGSVITASNTIIAFNTDGGNDGIALASGGSASGSYNNVYDDIMDPGVSFTNPISGDPDFVNPTTGNYHINSSSPNVDAGSPATPAAVDVDIDGRPRPVGSSMDVGADEYEADVFDVSLTPTFIQDGVDRGNTAVYTHTIENTGTAADTYTFTCSNSLGWSVNCPASVMLGNGDNTIVNTSVIVPGGAIALSQGTTVITASSQMSATLRQRAVIQSTVNPQPGLTFTPNYSNTVLPGDVITLTHLITNTGDSAETFLIQKIQGSWTELLPSDSFQLQIAQGDSRPIQVLVQVPPDAPAGLEDTTIIRASSQFDPSIFAEVTDEFRARPTVGTRFVSLNGDDQDNNCTQNARPCRTVGHAVGQASFGDEVRIAAGGPYLESGIPLNDTIHISGGWTSSTSQDEPDATVIDGGGTSLIFDIAPGAAIQPTISNLTLTGGDNGGPGGAVLVGNGAQPEFENVIFRGNQGTRGGAIYAGSNAFVIVRQSQFITNTATNTGGAIYVQGGTVSIQQSTFFTNTSANEGGAVYQVNGALNAVNNLFVGNNGSGDGGAVYLADGLDSGVTLINNTFVQNQSGGDGGAVFNGAAQNVEIFNTLLVGNAAGGSGGAIFQEPSSGSTVLSYSDLWQNSLPETSDVTVGAGMISADPLFVDAQYRLGRGSPALDVGTLLRAPLVDFEDDFRPSDAGVDMGYDELAGCRAQREGIVDPFGSIREAMAPNVPGTLIRVTGTCRGVFAADAGGGQIVNQTVFITRPFTIQGGWNNDFTAQSGVATVIDPEGAGRGFYIMGSITVTLENLTIVNGDPGGLGGGPTGEDAGGGIYNEDSTTILVDTRILSNTAVLGGGLYNDSGLSIFRSIPQTPSDLNPVSWVANNSATEGGGIYNNLGDVRIYGLRLYSNTAVLGGGLYNHTPGTATISNTIIYSNTASNQGAGIYNAGSGSYWHLVFFRNDVGSNGGGFYNAGGNPVMGNNIFQENSGSNGSAIFVAGGDPTFDYNYYYNNSGTPVVNSDPSDDQNSLSGPGDPGLLDPLGGNFHLRDGAPALDQGDPQSPIREDVDGEPRPSDQGPDIGADEIVGCLVTLNGTEYGSVQAALGDAQPGDTLLVSGICSGVHDYDTGSGGVGGGNPCGGSNGIIQATIHLTRSINLRGIGTPDDPTYLDAKGLGRVLHIAPGVTSTVEGFHIINGDFGNGAGICIDNAAPTIQNNHFYSHTATNGAAVYTFDSPAWINANRIYSNDAANGTVYADSSSGISTTIKNNFVYSNTANNGAAFYNGAGNNAFWHNTIYSNTASSRGGAFYMAAAAPYFQNNIVLSNTAGVDAGGAFGATGSNPQNVNYNNFFGQADDFGGTIPNGGTGHISADPLLANPAKLNFTLFYTSPVVDVGATVPVTDDFEADIRPSHQGFDMGADEFGGCYARVTGDPDTVYGSVQLAVDAAAPGDTVQVDGTCLGVHSVTLPGSSEQITQTVFINKELTLDGNWNYKTGVTATLDAHLQGRVLYISSGTTVTVTEFTLRGGDATLGGRTAGGGAIWNDGDLIVSQTSIVSNTAQIGGGIYNVTNLDLSGSVLQGNTAVDGGAFYNNAGSNLANLHGNNRFIGNSADNGGAVYQQDGVLYLNGNKIHDNIATGNGGGVYLGGGTDDTLDIINNFIYRNTAANGAGIFNENTNGRIWHNTIIFNNGSGLFNNSSAAGFTIHSNIFESNSGAGIESTLPVDIDYNNVYNNAPNYANQAAPGANDISAQPLYIDLSKDDFHIQEESPDVDKADPNITAIGDNLKSDYDGDIRPTNQGPDIGADEYNSCLIRVINPNDGTEMVFGVLQDAINYAESFSTDPLPTIEIARGACRGVKTKNGTQQVGYITKDLYLLGSLRRTDFGRPSPPDWNNPKIGLNSTVIDAQGGGRALYIENGASVTLEHLALVNGNAYNANDSNNHGGGLYFAGPGKLTTSESQACANYAENGGAYFFGTQAEAYITGANTANCYIAIFNDKDEQIGVDIYSGNTAVNNGGGTYVSNGASIDIVNHSFRLNSAENGNGGALFNASSPASSIHLINVYHTDNAANSGDGGSIYNTGSLRLYHNTLLRNYASGEGGAIYHGGSGFTLNSSILYQNLAGTGTTGGFYSTGGGTLDYNLFYDNNPGDSNIGLGGNVINEDPQTFFYGGLSLYSPAIDQADPDLLKDSDTDPDGVWPGGIDFDAGNWKRPDILPDYPDLNKAFTGYASDIGADEYWKEFGCDVKPDTQNTTVLPGDVVTYTVEIINVGNPSKLIPNAFTHGYTDSFTITLEATNPDWNIVLERDGTQTGKLNWYTGDPSPDRVSVVLTVTVPTTATIGNQEVSTIRCTSVARPTQSGTAVATTNVGQVNGIVVEPEYITTALPGDVITLTHYVTVTGNSPETIQLVPNAGAPGLSTAELISTSRGITNLVNLDVGEFITTYVRVTILNTAQGGGVATPGLIARSTLNPGVEGRAINQITIQSVAGTRYVAIGGTDQGNNCLDPQQPCATIQNAVDQATAGDTILVAAGTYTDLISKTVGADTFEQVVYLDKSLTIRGGYSVSENPPFTTMAPITNATILDGEEQHRLFTLADGIDVSIGGFFLKNGYAYDDSGVSVDTQTDYGGGIYNAGANLTITNTWFISSGARFGSGLYHLDGNLAVHNSVFANGNTGVSASGGLGSGAGINVVSGTVLLENNTFAYNVIAGTSLATRIPQADGDGAAVHHAGGPLTLRNNIFAFNHTSSAVAQSSAVFATNPGAVTNDFNLYYNNTGATNATNFPLGSNAITGANPDFEDAFFRIAATSAAKDTGTSAVSSASGIDFEMDPRPQGTDFDIGADERIQRPGFAFVPITQTAVTDPGVPHVYTHYLTNTGDVPDTYTLASSSSSFTGSGWQYQVTPSGPINLDIGEGAMVTLIITGTTPGDVATTIITATPQVASFPQRVIDTTIISSTPGVDIGPNRSGSAGPGTRIVYNHTLTNTGNGLAQFDIITATAVPANWTVTINPAQTGVLDPGVTTPFTVTVDVPAGTQAGAVHTVTVEAYPVLNPGTRDILTDTTTAAAAYGVQLSPDNTGMTPEDSTITYNHTLLNSGNIDDSYTLTVAGMPAGWVVDVQPMTTGVLQPLNAIPVVVTVTVPPGTAGQTHVVTVTATSTGDPGVTATAVNTTTVQEQRSVLIEPDNFRVTDAGSTVTHFHTVTNTGNVADTYTVNASSTQGWLVDHTPKSVNLASGATAQVAVTVTVPGIALPGDFDVTTVTVESTTDPAANDSATNTTRVRQQHGLLFAPDNNGQTDPNTSIAYTHYLTNTGNAPDQFQITANSSQGWAVAVPPPVDVNDGATATVQVTLTVPAGTGGLTDVMVVTATSTISNAFFATVQNTTLVSQTQGALDVTITPDNTGTGLPGDTLTYQHVVENTGTIAGDFNLSVGSSQSWIVSVNPTTIMSLAAGSTQPVTVTVTIPAGAQHNDQDVTTVTVEDVGGTLSDTATNTTTVDLTPALGVQIEPNNNGFGMPGDTVTYTHLVTNTGTLTDNYDLTAVSSGGWPVNLSINTLSLAPGTSALITVTTTIPGSALNGTPDTVVITATSQTVNTIFDTANDVTIVQIQGMGVLIEPDGQQTGLPGDMITYYHTLTNTSAAAYTFLLNAQSSQGWPITVVPNRLDNVGPDETRSVTVTVQIPLTAMNNDEDFTTVVATASISPSITDLAVDRTRVEISYGVEIEPDNSNSGSPGDIISYQHTVTNTGNFTETINLSVVSSQGWPVSVLPTSTTLSAGESSTLSVRVTIPAGATAGTIDTTTVTAATTTGTPVTDTATDTTTVMGAPPSGLNLYLPIVFSKSQSSAGVTITPDNNATGQPGNTMTYNHTVQNTGTDVDSFTITAVSDQGWNTSVDPASVSNLPPNGTQAVQVQVTIPAGAADNTVDVTTVTAANAGGTATDSAQDTTTVKAAVIPGVTITPDNTDTGQPGDTVTYNHTVQNTGTDVDSFTITAVSNQGWNISVNPATISSLPPNGTQAVQVQVTIPAGAADNTVDVTTVTAANTSGTATHSATDTTTVDVSVVIDVSITPDNSSNALPGATANYQHTVTNLGNTTETFALTANSGVGWAVSLQPTSMTLAAGQSDTVSVAVSIPINATQGTVDNTVVTAVSTTMGTVSDSATDTTTVSCTTTNIDLIVTDITLTPNPPVAGTPTTVEVTIRNQGSSDMDPYNNFYADFYVDRVPAYLLPGDIAWGVQAQYMTANSSHTLSGSFIFTGGTHELWAQVDTDNTVNECPYENNNVLGPITISVTGQQEEDGNNRITPSLPGTEPRATPTPVAGGEER